MGNCLKNQLKVTVNNDSLRKFNTIKITINNSVALTDANYSMTVGSSFGAIQLKIIGNGWFRYTTDINEVTTVKTYTANAPTQVRFSPGNYVIEITPYDKLEVFTLTTAALLAETEWVKYSKLLDYRVGSNQVSQTTEYWKENLPSTIKLFGAITAGDIRDFGIFPAIEYLQITTPSLYGNLEDFVAEQFINSRTQNTAGTTMSYLSPTVKFKGAGIRNANIKLYWQPNSVNSNYTDISFDGAETTILINSSAGVWSYVNSDKSKYTE